MTSLPGALLASATSDPFASARRKEWEDLAGKLSEKFDPNAVAVDLDEKVLRKVRAPFGHRSTPLLRVCTGSGPARYSFDCAATTAAGGQLAKTFDAEAWGVP